MNLPRDRVNIRYRIIRFNGQRSSSLLLMDWPTMKSPNDWTPGEKSRAFGENVFLSSEWPALMIVTGRVAPGFFTPEVVMQVKALACELPVDSGIPLSRWSTSDIAREVRNRGISATISDKTVWRWLHEDAIRPWQHRSWIFPRDPQFVAQAGRILDLYGRIWDAIPLKDDEFVVSADEKTSIQARNRRHKTLPPIPGSPMKVEAEYKRCGAWAYLAAMDVHRAQFFGRCEEKTGIAPFGRLVDQVMTQTPYNEARRVFWIVDNGSSHRGQASIQRLQGKYPNLILVHGPIHASWLNQIEIYFSIVQRKALTPNDFPSLAAVQDRLLNFQDYYESIAKPFEWKFSRSNLSDLLTSIQPLPHALAPAA